ncbi:MAG: RNA polymerase sigma factor, partial [Candidatus Zixiibacteriota bacterium]
DYEEAQDIAQTVFVKAFEKLDTFNPDYKFFSWIYRMMVNESINFLNKRKQFEELDQSITSPEKNPEELYNDNKLSQTVQEALMELHIEHRVAIVLRHFGNLSYREMSYVLELPEKTVKSRLFSARRVLNKILLKRGVIGND